MPRRRAHAPLDVYINGRLVGYLAKENDGAIRFAYAERWLEWQHAFAISLSLPLCPTPYVGAPSPQSSTTCCRTVPTFAGGLPSGPVPREPTPTAFSSGPERRPTCPFRGTSSTQLRSIVRLWPYRQAEPGPAWANLKQLCEAVRPRPVRTTSCVSGVRPSCGESIFAWSCLSCLTTARRHRTAEPGLSALRARARERRPRRSALPPVLPCSRELSGDRNLR